MTIYILSENPQETAQMLDDRSLDRMIKDIAQVLCNVHYLQSIYTPLSHNQNLSDLTKNIPLPVKKNKEGLSASSDGWSPWARKCEANYLYLVKMAEVCSRELNYRFKGLTQKQIDLEKILVWSRNNVPDLPDGEINEECKNQITQDSCDYNPCDTHAWGTPTPFPLVMPKKFQLLSHFNPDNWNTSFHIDNVIYAYRNYYQAKLKKQLDKTNQCDGCKSGDHDQPYPAGRMLCEMHKYLPQWTNREKPSWINLEK